ncbi:MAG: hypothetical protein ACT4OG_07860 [Alphaproteobacteria bacterium]
MMKITGMVLAVLAAALSTSASGQADPATVVLMCDTDGDNAVTQREWESCGAPTPYPGDADSDKDGRVTIEELMAVKSP